MVGASNPTRGRGFDTREIMAKEIDKENVTVSLPSSILAMLDHYCHEKDLTRSQAIGRAARLYLATKITQSATFWDEAYQKMTEHGKL
jgi:hypothetical protein